MKKTLFPALAAALVLAACGTKTAEQTGDAAEAVAPDTDYIIKNVQPVDTAEDPQRPKFDEPASTA